MLRWRFDGPRVVFLILCLIVCGLVTAQTTQTQVDEDLVVGNNIQVDGKVGIGTSTPVRNLQVQNSGGYGEIYLVDPDNPTSTSTGGTYLRSNQGLLTFQGMRSDTGGGGGVAMSLDHATAGSMKLGVGTSTSLAEALTLDRDTDGDDTAVTFRADTAGNSEVSGFMGFDPDKDFVYLSNGASTPEAASKIGIDNSGNVGIGTDQPATTLDLNGALTLRQLSYDPAPPATGRCVLWMSDGTESGDAGDIMATVNVGGTTKTITLIDYSAF